MDRKMFDGHGLSWNLMFALNNSLNNAGYPSLVVDRSQDTVVVMVMSPSPQLLTLTVTVGWLTAEGNADDLSYNNDEGNFLVDVAAALSLGGFPVIVYGGEDSETMYHNVLISSGSTITVALGWPEVESPES